MTRNTRASFLTPRREYPGYDFRSGYGSADAVEADYSGLGLLLKETRDAFGSGASARVLSMAYYPDGRQEQLLKKHNMHAYTDFLNIMSYVKRLLPAPTKYNNLQQTAGVLTYHNTL